MLDRGLESYQLPQAHKNKWQNDSSEVSCIIHRWRYCSLRHWLERALSHKSIWLWANSQAHKSFPNWNPMLPEKWRHKCFVESGSRWNKNRIYFLPQIWWLHRHDTHKVPWIFPVHDRKVENRVLQCRIFQKIRLVGLFFWKWHCGMRQK